MLGRNKKVCGGAGDRTRVLKQIHISLYMLSTFLCLVPPPPTHRHRRTSLITFHLYCTGRSKDKPAKMTLCSPTGLVNIRALFFI